MLHYSSQSFMMLRWWWHRNNKSTLCVNTQPGRLTVIETHQQRQTMLDGWTLWHGRLSVVKHSKNTEDISLWRYTITRTTQHEHDDKQIVVVVVVVTIASGKCRAVALESHVAFRSSVIWALRTAMSDWLRLGVETLLLIWYRSTISAGTVLLSFSSLLQAQKSAGLAIPELDLGICWEVWLSSKR